MKQHHYLKNTCYGNGDGLHIRTYPNGCRYSYNELMGIDISVWIGFDVHKTN